jgi:hypothetical protein
LDARLALFLVLAAAAGAPRPVLASEPSPEAVDDGLYRAVAFMRERVAPGGYAWSYAADLGSRKGEARMTQGQAWVQPPGIPAIGTAFLQAYEATGESYHLDAAREAAAMLLKSQLRSGGWWYVVDLDPAAARRWCYRQQPSCRDLPEAEDNDKRNTSTLDDNTTQAALAFLIRLDQRLPETDPALREAIRHGLAKLIEAQYPNGAWPIRLNYRAAEDPLKEARANYPTAWPHERPPNHGRLFYTTNDYLIRDIIRLLLLAHRSYGRPGYLRSALRAGEFLLSAQMPAPQLGWAQQYDRTMAPMWGRKFEPPAIASRETAGNVEALLELYLYTGDRRWLDPCGPAIAWLESSRLADGDWARFYELATNRPLYMTSSYELTYSDADLPTHYGFKSQIEIPLALERYRQVVATDRGSYLAVLRSRSSPSAADPLAAAVASALADLDPDGRWVENGKIRSQTFVDRVELMATYLAARAGRQLVVGKLDLELLSEQ